MRKIFTFLFAALMSAGMFAATEVTITDSDFPAWGESFTKDGVTVSAGSIDGMYGNISGPGSFSTTLGNFTKIEVSAASISVSGEGWSGDSEHKTWTGNASSVSFIGDINGYEEGTTLKFTIEPASTPEPAGEVTVVFAANNKTVERTVTLPHDFSCSYSDKNGELDAIIKELYEISAGHCSDDNYPVASGNEAVVAGSNGFDNYITISAAFEGTAMVSGVYWNSDAYDGDGDWMNYSLTISIKGDEPQPQMDKTAIYAAFPAENHPAEIEIAFINRDFTWGMEALDNKPWYASELNLMTSAEDTIKFRDKANNAMILCEFIPANGAQEGRWQQMYVKMANYEVVSFKNEMVRLIEELDLRDAAKYAWMENAPEPLPEGIEHIVLTEKAQKVIVDGMVYIVRDGKLFNLTGAQVR